VIVKAPWPANDNVLANVRPLSLDDVTIILEENALILANAIDDAARYSEFRENPLKGAVLTIAHFSEIQRSIVWRGSWLKRREVDRLQEGGSLLVGCFEVLRETIAHCMPGELQEIIREHLRSYSKYLIEREGK